MSAERMDTEMRTDQKRVLFVATVDDHIRAFHIPYLKWFQEQGWETCVAANGGAERAFGTPLGGGDGRDGGNGAGRGGDSGDRGAKTIPYCDHKYEIGIQRSPFDRRNLVALKQLKRILSEKRFDVIHCHTPMGGVLGRLAARPHRRKGTKLFYTAHGFHFYKGASRKAWLTYYPIENWLSRYTDVLITINGEDYALAKAKMHAGDVRLVHGIGYDESRYYPRSAAERTQLRGAYGYSEQDRLLVFVAEMNENKNQELLIRAMRALKDAACARASDGSRVRLLLVGPDSLGGRCRRRAEELGVADDVDFLGHRDDADRIVAMCDIALSSSLREGLPVNVMEAMACGLPVIATDVRGNRDLVEDGVTGYLVAPGDDRTIAAKAAKLLGDKTRYEEISHHAADFIQRYSRGSVLPEMEAIYAQNLLL